MKHCAFCFFTIFINICAFADTYWTDTVQNACDESTLKTDNNNSRLVAVFERNQYTCQSGQYLPAGMTTCAFCPSGETCLGGVFLFNKQKNQGITYSEPFTDTKTNACTVDFLKDASGSARIRAQFVPNTLTVNFNNNGSIESTTCEYNSELNLPPVPSRVGYVFTGWKIKNND